MTIEECASHLQDNAGNSGYFSYSDNRCVYSMDCDQLDDDTDYDAYRYECYGIKNN